VPESSSNYQQGDKFLRVLQILERLQTTQVGRTTRELADELDVQQRTVQRYIEQMQRAGLDIERDEEGRYRVGEGSKLPPMQLTRPEAVQMLIALRLLQQMETVRDDALIGAVAKLAGAMRVPTVTAYLGTMLASVETAPEAGAREHVERIVEHCFADRVPCEIEYENSAGAVTKRVVRPYFLEPRPESRTVFVYAQDGKSGSPRWFRMDRIRHARAVPMEGVYSVPEDFDIEAVTRSSWGVWQPGDALVEVVLRFAPEAAGRVRQSMWHDSASLSELDGGGVEMRVQVASDIEMRPWVLGWGASVEVVEPAGLRQFVAESMRAGVRVYGEG
jgi:predicted DNA-binding transcriptional regulator YafY